MQTKKLKRWLVALTAALSAIWRLSHRPSPTAVVATSTAASAVTVDTTKPVSEITAPASGWNFRNHVIPVLTKLGCNSGACHGAAAGKNGFKLTLRGYDP